LCLAAACGSEAVTDVDPTSTSASTGTPASSGASGGGGSSAANGGSSVASASGGSSGTSGSGGTTASGTTSAGGSGGSGGGSLGASCQMAGQCQTGFCVDGVCCDTACDTECESCALMAKEGNCSPHPVKTDPEVECSSGGYCDGKGWYADGDAHWAKGFGEAGNEYSLASASGPNGEIAITGYAQSTLNFGGQALPPGGGDDVFLAVFDTAGQHIFSKRAGDGAGQYGTGVAIDKSGNVYVCGHFQSSINFGGATLGSFGGFDIFVAKYDKTGAHLWSKRFGDGSADFAESITVDSNDRPILTGSFGGTINFGGAVLTSSAGEDLYLAKLETNGDHALSKRFAASGNAYGYAVAVGPSDEVVAVGDFDGTIDFGSGPHSANATKSAFVARFDANFVPTGSATYGTSGKTQPRAVAIGSTGDIVVSGFFDGSIDFGGGLLTTAGSNDVFLVRFNAQLMHDFSKRWGSFLNQQSYGVALDAHDNIVMVGGFNGILEFAPLVQILSSGEDDVFVVKFAWDGTPLWQRLAADVYTDRARDVSIDTLGNIAVVGNYIGALDWGYGPLPAPGGAEIFLSRLEP
jgi:hypothetical protein